MTAPQASTGKESSGKVKQRRIVFLDLVHLTVLGFISLYSTAIGNPLLFLLAFIAGTLVLGNIVFYVEFFGRRQLRKLSLHIRARNDLD